MVHKKILALVLVSIFGQLAARDIRLGFKGSYFLPTSSRFRHCYKGSALYGPEFSIQIKECKNWYAFASLDYFKQKGRCLSLCDSTTLRMVPLALGVTYNVCLCKRVDLYTGLGFQPVYLRKKDWRGCNSSTKSFWGYGGLAKLGASIHLPCNFFGDIFFNYSFAWTSKNRFYGYSPDAKRVNLSGAIFGARLSYRF